MNDAYQRYRSPEPPVPAETWAWNLYGAGVESIGRGGKPERFPVPQPGPDQLLVRVDAVGMCFSDMKLIKQGGKHPKLYGRDLAREPTRLGHEVALTVVRVGSTLRGRFRPGMRLALQPDIYVQGRSTAYGYTIPGGLTQYHLSGRRCSRSRASASSCRSRPTWVRRDRPHRAVGLRRGCLHAAPAAGAEGRRARCGSWAGPATRRRTAAPAGWPRPPASC